MKNDFSNKVLIKRDLFLLYFLFVCFAEAELAKAQKLESDMSHCDAGGQQPLTEKLTDYEKNKRKLKKSHLADLGHCSTYGSTDRSDRALPPTATLRGTN